jgi:hypothetical protein
MSEPGEFWHFPFPPPPEKKKGFLFFSDTFSITLVVYGLPIGDLVCLCQSAVVDVVGCSCEGAGQLVYGPRTSFLGSFVPCRCRTNRSTLVVVWPVVDWIRR